ncbi:MAG: phosphotransferase [Candidatus Dadabacteria bacterium]|nr:phosphotransferase [Candidatus Dadabacteria bacterium]
MKEDSKNKQKKLVLKLGLGVDKSTELIWQSEKQVMSKLFDCGYPVPRIYSFGENLIPNRGAYFVMEYIEGKNLSEEIDLYTNDLKKIDNHLNRYAKLMVELHNLKCNDEMIIIGRKNEMFTSGQKNPITVYLEDYLKFANNIKYGTISAIINWLLIESKNLEVPLELGMTHGDFQTDNVLLKENGDFCVIDWGFSRTADIRLDTHWSSLLNRFRHNSIVSDNIYSKYLELQDRELTDDSFFQVVAMVRLLIGLSHLAYRSKNYHGTVNKFIGTMDMDYMQRKISKITGLTLPNLESDFREVNGLLKSK